MKQTSSPTVPRGNTQPGVIQKIYDFLSPLNLKPQLILDIPCGKGEFLLFLQNIYPTATTVGVDLFEKPLPEIQKQFVKSDMRDWSFAEGKKFDLIFSVSGIMQCDDLFGFFDKSQRHLSEGGRLLVTNDNIMTLRDRFSFFCFGEVKRFRKYFSRNEGNWNLVLIPALYKHFENYGFQEIEIHYCTLKPEDFLFTPLIPFFMLLDTLHLLMAKSDWPIQKRLTVYSWRNYLYRHYFITGVKSQN